MKTLLLLTALGISASAQAQNNVSGPIGLFGSANAGATTVASGGTITIGAGGGWTLAGNITSADKGGANSPSATGRAETVIFDGGTYSGAATTAGTAGNVIDGYATTTANNTAVTQLPLGNGTIAFPLTIPTGIVISAAYFDGSGSTTNSPISGPVNGGTATEYSQYYDIPGGYPAGNYAVSYPASLPNSGFNAIVKSTDNGSTFVIGSNVTAIGAAAGTTNAVALTAMGSAVRLYLSTTAVPLPLHLMDFTAAKGAHQTAILHWQTAKEDHTDYFGVEHSTDSRTWTPLGNVTAKSGNGDYGYTHSHPATGINFYRLRMVDYDGRQAYSPVRSLNFDVANGNNNYVVYPNPAQHTLYIKGLTGTEQVKVYDMTGRALMQVNVTGSEAHADLSGLANATYYVVISDNSTTSFKVVKQD